MMTRNDLITHNDVAGAILQMLGTVLAIHPDAYVHVYNALHHIGFQS